MICSALCMHSGVTTPESLQLYVCWECRLAWEQTKIAVSIFFRFHFMLAAVIKITSKLARSLALGHTNYSYYLQNARARQCQHKFHNLWTTNTHKNSQSHTHWFSHANTCFRCTFCTLGIFICSFLGFCGFRKRIKKSSEGDFIV